jgi:CDP-diacylglycerol--glycerol-3-phosphate 3-phosphatidyltransferase
MNWPNGLTVGRLLLGPVVLVCVIAGAVRLSFYLFVVAMLTDLYDGYLARISNNVTEFGKLMDPLADKVLVSLVLVGFVFLGLPYVPLWMVAAIVGRELLILGCRTGAFKSGEGFVTSRIAKWKTAAQMTWIASVLLYLTVLSRSGHPISAQVVRPVEAVLWVFGTAAVVLTIVSGAEYLLNGRSFSRSANDETASERGERS